MGPKVKLVRVKAPKLISSHEGRKHHSSSAGGELRSAYNKAANAATHMRSKMKRY